MYAQVVNFVILKVKDIAIFAAKMSILLRSWICLPSQLIVRNHVNWHRENLQSDGKKTRKYREFENTI